MILEKFTAFNQPDLGEEEMAAVMDVIRSGWIGTGNVAAQFEEEFAQFMGGGYAVAVSSCTIGLQICLRVLGITELDEVVTTPLTFAATINSILNLNSNPILIDVDPKSGCLDVKKVNKHDHLLTKAIIPVHYSGNLCDIEAIEKPRGAFIIEDCAHAFGSKLKRTGDFQVFSFYANKNITAGEGGMILTKDKQLADKARVIASQGLSVGAWARYGSGPVRGYSVQEVGFKGNLPDILAAIGLTQLRRWPSMREKRDQIFKVYQEAFGYLEGHSTHFYPLRIKNRDKVRLRLHEKGFGTGIHYKPIHLERAYKSLAYTTGDFPEAEAWGEEELSLPVSSTMEIKDAERIVEIIKGME